MKNYKKIGALIAIAALLVTGTVGCGQKETVDTIPSNTTSQEVEDTVQQNEDGEQEQTGNNTEEQIVIRASYTNGFPWNPAFDVAYQEGLFDEVFADDNVTVEITDFGNGPAINEAFLAGEVDIATSMGDQPILNALHGKKLDVKVLSTASIISSMGLVVSPDSEIQSVEELKGKKVASEVGTSQHKALLYILEDYGLAADDIELVVLTGNDTKEAALAKGEVDAIFLNGYAFNTVESRGIGKVITDSANHPSYCYVEISGDFYEQHPDLVEKFLTACVKGHEILVEDPERGYQAISDLLNVDVDEIRTGLEGVDSSIILNDEAIQNLYDTSDFLVNQEILPEGVDQEIIDQHISDVIYSITN